MALYGVRVVDGLQRYGLRLDAWDGERSYGDFLRLSHARKGTVEGEGLPKRALRVLAEAAPWTLNGDGWRPELTASVRRVENWLKADLAAWGSEPSPTAHFLSDSLPLTKSTHNYVSDQVDEGAVVGPTLEAEARDRQQYFCVEVKNCLVIQCQEMGEACIMLLLPGKFSCAAERCVFGQGNDAKAPVSPRRGSLTARAPPSYTACH